jgi:signal transduction histidine kinase
LALTALLACILAVLLAMALGAAGAGSLLLGRHERVVEHTGQLAAVHAALEHLDDPGAARAERVRRVDAAVTALAGSEGYSQDTHQELVQAWAGARERVLGGESADAAEIPLAWVRQALVQDLERHRDLSTDGRRFALGMALSAGVGALLVVATWALAARAIRRWRLEISSVSQAAAAGDARRSLLLDAVEVGALEVDPHTWLVHLSRAAHRLVRRPPIDAPMAWDEAFGKVDAEDRERMKLTFREARGRVDGRIQVEIRVPRPDAGPTHVEVTGRLIRNARGEPDLIVAVVRDVTAQVTAEEARRAFTQRLEAEVAARTAEVERRAAEARGLAAEIAVAEGKERQRIAHVLHDGLQQTLMAARLRLAGGSTPEVREGLEPLLLEAIQECRTLSATLDPPVDPDAGLGPALRWLAQRLQDRHGLVVDVSGNALAERLLAQHGVLLFRAAHELLFNVIKHAGTGRAWAHFDHVDGRHELVIRDRGPGVSPDDEGTGIGLANLRRRLQAFGGGLAVEEAPGGGCLVRAWLPARPVVGQPTRRVAPTTPSGLPR